MALPLLVVRTGIRPEPDEARRWVRDELARSAYREGLLERFSGWLSELFRRLQTAAEQAGGLSVAAAVLLGVLLLAVIVLVASRVRRETSAARPGSGDVVDTTVTADEHRRLAEQALRGDDAALALVEAFRAIAARAVQRAVLAERPDLTAHELADELGPRFPGQADAVARAAELFDLVFYGDQAATPEDAGAVLSLDEELRRTRPAPGEAAPAPVPAVPR